MQTGLFSGPAIENRRRTGLVPGQALAVWDFDGNPQSVSFTLDNVEERVIWMLVVDNFLWRRV